MDDVIGFQEQRGESTKGTIRQLTGTIHRTDTWMTGRDTVDRINWATVNRTNWVTGRVSRIDRTIGRIISVIG